MPPNTNILHPPVSAAFRAGARFTPERVSRWSAFRAGARFALECVSHFRHNIRTEGELSRYHLWFSVASQRRPHRVHSKTTLDRHTGLPSGRLFEKRTCLRSEYPCAVTRTRGSRLLNRNHRPSAGGSGNVFKTFSPAPLTVRQLSFGHTRFYLFSIIAFVSLENNISRTACQYGFSEKSVALYE